MIEDRRRQGFELQTTYRFLPGPDGKIQQQKAMVASDEEPLAELTYAAAPNFGVLIAAGGEGKIKIS